MIEDIYLNPIYWVAVAALLCAAALLSKARVLSFGFVTLAFVSQYVVHAALAFGFSDAIFWFSAAFLLTLIIGLRAPSLLSANGVFGPRPSGAASEKATGMALSRNLRTVEPLWLTLSKVYLIVYGGLRLATYPWLGGALDLGARLDASQDNRAVFFLGLGLLPAIAAVATQWLRRGYVLGLVDWLAGALTCVALLASGSKATIIPATLTIIGAAYLAQRPLRSRRFFLIGGAAAVVASAVGYAVAVASDGVISAARAFLYRLASNSDSLEYLLVLDARPSDFPYAGIGALVPTLAKRLGYPYEFSPGVWLHGERFNQWGGFGPNPGLVVDYFGNVGWFGLALALAIGLYCWGASTLGGAIGASFAAITYLTVVDVTLFQFAFALWFSALVLIVATRWILIRTRSLDRVTKVWSTIVGRVPLLVRGGFRSPPPLGWADSAPSV